MLERTTLLGAGLAILPVAASAQTADVVFDGLILSSCTVLAGTPGTLAATPAGDVLSSEGGLPGSADIVATGAGYQATVDPPGAFSVAPPGADEGTAFSVRAEATGATLLVGLGVGDLLTLGIGTTTLRIDAEARRPGAAFPAGTYRLVTTVRCFQP